MAQSAATPATSPSPNLSRNLSRNPELTRVATLERTIGASLERVWENVRDWAHLPWLHGRAFAQIECQGEGEWGWRAAVTYPGGKARSEIELLIDAPAERYVTRVVGGAGVAGEIWTTLRERAARETDIVVEFCMPLEPGEEAEAVGQGYLTLYSMLWDEDEQMMQQRERELDRRSAAGGEDDRIDLGPRDELLRRLPLEIEAFGTRLRVYLDGDEPAVHGLVCPHLLGPLDDDPAQPGELVCPWHGYRFDRASGRSCDGERFRVANPAKLTRDGEHMVLLRASA